jgi:hypothetical protein
LISYNRLAFNGRGDAGLRISFDTELRGRTHDLRLESGGYGELLLDPEYIVLEVKALASLPLWLTHLLSSQRAFAGRFSKYRIMYENTLTSKMEASYA